MVSSVDSSYFGWIFSSRVPTTAGNESVAITADDLGSKRVIRSVQTNAVLGNAGPRKLARERKVEWQ